MKAGAGFTPHVAARPPAGRDAYGYTWSVPATQAPPAKDLTIAVVRPDWARESSVSSQTHKAFADGFSSSLAADLDEILIAKGIKVSGPFPSYDDITYSDKKSADLALTPTVFLTMSNVKAFAANTVVDPATGAPQRVDVGPPLYRGVEEAIGDAMMRWYPVIAQKAWTYLDSEEMATLKPRVDEIREHSGSLIK